MRTCGSHFESRMFCFSLHFTNNQKHTECFICRLQKQIKQAILYQEEFILPVAQKSSSVYTSKPITCSPHSARLIATSLLSVTAPSLGGVMGAGLIFPPDAHYSILFCFLKMCSLPEDSLWLCQDYCLHSCFVDKVPYLIP